VKVNGQARKSAGGVAPLSSRAAVVELDWTRQLKTPKPKSLNHLGHESETLCGSTDHRPRRESRAVLLLPFLPSLHQVQVQLIGD